MNDIDRDDIIKRLKFLSIPVNKKTIEAMACIAPRWDGIAAGGNGNRHYLNPDVMLKDKNEELIKNLFLSRASRAVVDEAKEYVNKLIESGENK